jgi:septum formation protein
MTDRPLLVLASASPRRHALLEQAGCPPDALMPTDIDETPRRGEAARSLVQRLAKEKLEAALLTMKSRPDLSGAYTVSADTVVACTGRILPKAETPEEAEACLRLLSGRSHIVMTGVAVANPQGTVRTRLVETRLRFKHLSLDEINAYLDSGEWRGKAGGYAIQGHAASFIRFISGSYSNVVGLPLFETAQLLRGIGWAIP